MKSFNSFGAFAQHLAALGSVAAFDAVNHHLLEESAQMIEKRAKDKIGEYQAAAGQFAAWAPLTQSTKEDRVRQGFPDDEPLLRTGGMRDSIEHKSDSQEAHIGSDSDIAKYQELGTSKIPPRSFLGGAAFEKASEVVDLIGEGMTMHLEGKGLAKVEIKY